MAVQLVLLLGDPLLWQRSAPFPVPGAPRPTGSDGSIAARQHLAAPELLHELNRLHADLRDTLLWFRRRGIDAKAIAAPQIGVLRRVVYVHEPGAPSLLVNPVLKTAGPQVLTWENCLSFPGLSVKTKRASTCVITYMDENLVQHTCRVSGHLSVILQHECDHLDGILCLERAADAQSFFLSAKGRMPPGVSAGQTK